MVTRWRSELFFFLYFKIYLSGAWQMFRPITFQVLPPFFSAPDRDVCQLSQSVVWWNTCVFFFSGFVFCLFFNQRSRRPQPIMASGLLVLFSSCSSEVYDGLDVVCLRACFSPAIAHHESQRRRVPATDCGWYNLHISCGPEWMCPAGPAASSARSGLCLSSGTTNHPHFLSSLFASLTNLPFIFQ